jgi:hypothetical protein
MRRFFTRLVAWHDAVMTEDSSPGSRKRLRVGHVRERGSVNAVRTLLEAHGLVVDEVDARSDYGRDLKRRTVSQRYKRLVTQLGINTSIKMLRHYLATGLLSVSVDIRTVTGRLGHGGGTTPEGLRLGLKLTEVVDSLGLLIKGGLWLSECGVRRTWSGARTGVWPFFVTPRKSAGTWRRRAATSGSAATSSTGGNATGRTKAWTG